MEYKLKELFDLQMGKTPSRNNSDYWNTKDNKWISIADLSKCEKYITDTKEYISDIAIKESGINPIPANTVVMSFKLSIGKTAITKEVIYSNEAIMSFRDKKTIELLPDYTYYLMMSKRWDEGTNKAVMGKTLNKTTLSEIKVSVHDIAEQHRIVNILDKVVDLIDKRKQQLSKLDELVKARFVEMFGHKNFPIIKLEKLCNVGSSKRIYQCEQSTIGIPFLRISDLNERIDTGNKKNDLYIPVEKYEELLKQGLVPKENDILVTSRGTLGKCYIVSKEDCFYFQDGMISWLSNIDECISSKYISYLFSMPMLQKQIEKLQTGSTVSYLSIAMLNKLDISVPPIELQNQFADFVKQVDKSKFEIKQSLEKLELLKKALMQKYFG